MGKVVRYFDNNFPKTLVAIGKPKNKNTNFEVEQWKNCYGLIDTAAASTTIISKKIADDLNLEEIGKAIIMSASHESVDTYKYDVIIAISVNEKIKIK